MGEVFLLFIIVLEFALIIASILFFAFMCRFIAKRKNRSAIGYFFLGLFTGLIGLIIALALPKIENKEEVNDNTNQDDVIDVK